MRLPSSTGNLPLRIALVGVGYGLIALSYAGLLALGPAAASNLAREDGPIEGLGAIFALLGSVLLLTAYLGSSGHANRFLGRGTERNVWLLILAVLLFVWCGEEISWGQRIFGWPTPAFLSPLSAQNETNLHNLVLFNPRDAAGNARTGLSLMLSFNRLLNVFWVIFFLVVPILHGSLGIAQRALAWLGLPIAPLAAGLLFPANYAGMVLSARFAATFIEAGSQPVFQRAIHELSETNYAFCFALYGAWLLVDAPRPRSTPAESAPRPCDEVAAE